MNNISAHKFFKKNGKALKAFVDENLTFSYSPHKRKELVSSLFEERVSTLAVKDSSFFDRELAIKVIRETHDFQNKIAKTIKKERNRYALLTGIVITFGLVYLSSLLIPQQIQPKLTDKYYIYSSKPLTVSQITAEINKKDSRAQKIDEVFKLYDCPLEGLGAVFVEQADANNIPWWLTAAVSFQESGCGKKTPEVNGRESYNAWGWGVYGTTVNTFDNWARGIETVSKYFNDKFYSNGVTELCDIMKTYTPPSNGSWCQGIKHFGDMIQNYQSPLI